MLVEATETPITYRLRSGQVVVLQPGIPVELSDQAGRQLLRKAGDKVRSLTAGRVKTIVLRVREPLALELDGRAITFDQWACFTVAADQASGLTEQFPTQLEALTLLPDEPLQPGWLVAYRDRQGVLCGGCDDRAHGTVQACQWDEKGWTVHLTDGQRLPLSMIRSIGQTDEAGHLMAAWTVREHGLDGRKGGEPA